ncbi:hypothetical protein C8F04DRAFT_1226969 [Mycena alexandri]|uniref:Nucleolus and neural progenitor protein-like N-terminal domain-containing protein n=1 Tax=Mycena alexandri TaxID=1745969 RepID=A0AAD6TIH4_9AGAR|nr:hypothetical protein C8F04DRAFT_1226969 [Mycena alexandri]
MPKRSRQPPLLGRAAKTALDATVHPDIDAALKQLKLCARNLQPVLATFSDELHILHRLYYKGKNEHRSALFWRRVAEMRRYGDRVEERALSSLVDSLRYSFFAEDLQQTSKLLKGSWTHYPDPSSVSFVLERLAASLTLVKKMHERLAHAYQSFSLAMQTGAFLQLLLTLAGIASRLTYLASELGPILEQTQDAVFRILTALDPGQITRRLFRTRQLTPLHTAIDTSGQISTTDLYEDDTGVSIPRQDTQLDPYSSNTAHEDVLPAPNRPPPDIPSSATEAKVVKRTMTKKLKRSSDLEHSTVKKKRKERDEIDDIFG